VDPSPARPTDLDFFINACPFAIIEWSRALRVLRWSPEAARIFGWQADEVVGKRPDEWPFTHPDDQAAVKRALGQTLVRSAPPAPTIGRNFTRDGRLLHCEWHNRANRDAHGRLVSLLSFAKDLTRQFQTENALDASEARYASIFANSHAVMLIVDPDGFRIVDANPAAEVFYGWSRDRLCGMRIDDINTLQPDEIKAEMERARRADRRHFEFRHRRADGSIRDVEVYSGPIVHGGRTLLFSIVHDVSARKAAELTLRKLSRAVEESPESIAITNLDAEIEYVNESFVRKSGYRTAELLGQNPRILQSGKTPRSTYEDMWATLAQGRSWTGDLHNRSKDGHEYYERARITPIHGDRGAVTHYVAVKEDITEARRMEAELERYREHLEHLVDSRTRDLSAALEAAEAASRAKSDFLATMSHEIRTPMNGVVGLVDVLARSPLDDDQVDLVDTMRESAAILLRLIDDILDFSKIESGHLELELHPVSLTELIERVGDNLQAVAARRGVALSVFVAPDLPQQVLTDGLRVQQILTNLAGNAIKFSSGEGRAGVVEIRAARSASGRLSISVRDNGIGMSADVAQRLFRPFAQAESSTTRRFGGTGLGLAISRRLVELLGGDIDVHSTPAVGACFTVSLPLEPASTAEQPQARTLAGLLCIIAADDSSLVTDWGSYLAHAGARVKRAQNIEQALRFIGATDKCEAVLLTDRPLEDDSRSRWQRMPATHRPGIVLIMQGARRQARQAAQGLYPLDREGMHRESLIRAVAAAGGRSGAATLAGPPQRRPHPHTARPLNAATAPRILVAEDNDINRKVIARQLQLLGLQCEMSADGEQALARWREGGIDLLLTDLHMPNMDGYTLSAHIRSDERAAGAARHLPIIAVTANALHGEDHRCRDAGMDDYIVKPVQLDTLQETLERNLRQAPPAPGVVSALASPAPGPAAAVLDPAVLARLIGDDPALIEEFLHEYGESARRTGNEILLALREARWTDAAGAAHRLKSASRSVGALALGDLCAELEAHCRQPGQAPQATIDARFSASLRAVLESIDARAPDRPPA